jgi:hypothetical protein
VVLREWLRGRIFFLCLFLLFVSFLSCDQNIERGMNFKRTVYLSRLSVIGHVNAINEFWHVKNKFRSFSVFFAHSKDLMNGKHDWIKTNGFYRVNWIQWNGHELRFYHLQSPMLSWGVCKNEWSIGPCYQGTEMSEAGYSHYTLSSQLFSNLRVGPNDQPLQSGIYTFLFVEKVAPLKRKVAFSSNPQ